MWIERFENIEYRPGYVASGWISYEEELNTHLDIYDWDWSATSIDGNFRCPLTAEEQAVGIVVALEAQDDRYVEMY